MRHQNVKIPLKDVAITALTLFTLIFCVRTALLDDPEHPSTLRADITALKTAQVYIHERTERLGRFPNDLDEAELKGKIGDNPLEYTVSDGTFTLALKRLRDTITIDHNGALSASLSWSFADFSRNMKFYSEWLDCQMPWLNIVAIFFYSLGLWYLWTRKKLLPN